MREHKTLALAELKIAGGDAGEFEGRASTFGTVDSYGDTIDPGAYKDTIPQFLTRGFIGWGHDWADPIGIVTKAEERDDGLWITGQFHSDPDAQRWRIRARERVESNKFMGLSIGYEAEEYEMRELEAPVRNRWGEWTDKVRALTKIKLYEVSLVTVPAEENSGVATIKGYGFDVPLADQAFSVRVALEELCARLVSASGTGEKAGRAISAARRQLIEAVSTSLRLNAQQLDELLGQQDDDAEEAAADPVIGLDGLDAQRRQLIERRDWLVKMYGG